jgi:hypothetical protein
MVCFAQEEIPAIPQSAKQRAPAAFFSLLGAPGDRGGPGDGRLQAKLLEHQFVPNGE